MKKTRLILSFIFVLLITCSMVVFPQTAYADTFPHWLPASRTEFTTVGDTAITTLNGIPYIAFTSGATTSMNVLKNNGSGWLAAGIPSAAAYNKDISLIANNGFLYLAYLNPARTSAYVYKCDPATAQWIPVGSTISITGDTMEKLRLCVSEGGVPYVAFAYTTSHDKKVYCYKLGEDWKQVGDTLQSADNNGLGFCLSGSTPYIAYKDVGGTGIIEQLIGGAWQIYISSINSDIYQIAAKADGRICGLYKANPGQIEFIEFTPAYIPPTVLTGDITDSAIAVYNNDVYILTLNASHAPVVYWFNGKAVRQLGATTDILPSSFADLAVDGDGNPCLSVTSTIAYSIYNYKYQHKQAASLDASAITVANNPVGTADTVTVTGLFSDARICIYADSAGKTLLGKSYATDSPPYTATVSIPQLGRGSGSVYVGVCQNGYTESTPQQVTYTGEPYTVSFDLQGGTSSTTSQVVNFGTPYGTLPTPAKTGYIFGGWYTAKNGGGTQITSGATVSLSANQQLFAKWTKADYAIIYYLNGGKPSATNPAGYNVESSAFTLKNPTKSGYIFAGWTGTGLSGATVTVTIPTGSVGNRAYTATWKPICAIKAAVNNKKYGTVTGARTYYGGDTVTLTAVPANGYLLQNWTEGKTKVSTAGVYTFTATKARTLTANFAKIGTPTLSSVKASGKGSLTIAWKSVSGVKGYYVYRATSKSGKYAKVQTVSGALKFTDIKLTSGKTYYYKVQAYYTAGSKTTTGGFSKVLSAKVK